MADAGLGVCGDRGGHCEGPRTPPHALCDVQVQELELAVEEMN
jgi:hypothetical protein